MATGAVQQVSPMGQAPTIVPNFPASATPTPGKREKKTYWTRIPNSTFWVQRGPAHATMIQFRGDHYNTEDAVEQDQLDSASDVIGSPIYTKAPIIDPGEIEAQKEIQAQAAKAAKEAGQAG